MPGSAAPTVVAFRQHERCPSCDSERVEYEFTVSNARLLRCSDCSVLFLHETPAGAPPSDDETVAERVRDRIAHFIAHVAEPPARLLVLIPPGSRVCIDGATVADAERFAFGDGSHGMYDGAVCVDSLDRVEDPPALLERLRLVLADGAPVAFTVPSVDSSTARYAGSSWRGFRSGAWLFHGVDTLQNVLVRHGFRDSRVYVDGAFRSHSLRMRGIANLLGAVRLRSAAVRAQSRARYLDESVTMICRRGAPIERYRLSVIVPVYNERRTLDDVLTRLIAKRIEGVDIEIIIVESNSTDGSRAAVLAYAGCPGVEIVLQDNPRGKGNAVRSGIARATGDIVLFQDADLEYEIEDYDDLIRPIVAFRHNFVIGSRHKKKGGAWKMRKFSGAPVLSQIFNAGHIVFLALLNGLYGQSLDDPFSMFKVFRRDCLAGLVLECDRFDFDFEIVIKLVRKGYRPHEIPVNYNSRSIAEGKKVTVVRDPLTWLVALARFRTSRLYPNDT